MTSRCDLCVPAGFFVRHQAPKKPPVFIWWGVITSSHGINQDRPSFLSPSSRQPCLFPRPSHVWPRGITEGTEQLFGLYGDFTLSGNFEKGSPWRYESEVLMVAAQAGRPFPPSGQSIDLAAVGSYNSLGYPLNEHHSLFIGYAFQHVLPPLSGQPGNRRNSLTRLISIGLWWRARNIS